MDYLDRVYVELKDRQPGRYPIHNLKEPERFIAAVKELIDGEWLTEVYFSEDFQILVVELPFELIFNNKIKIALNKD